MPTDLMIRALYSQRVCSTHVRIATVFSGVSAGIGAVDVGIVRDR